MKTCEFERPPRMATAMKLPAVFALLNASVVVVVVPASLPMCWTRAMLAGGVVTVKGTPLLASPETVTTTLPVVAPAGTGTTMLVKVQLVGVAGTPLKVTVLAPCVPPKSEPVIVTDAPTGPDVGLRLLIPGVTWKTALLVNPPTVT